MTNRRTLEADLIRYRQSGDFAAQAATLFALAEFASEEEEYRLAQALYGQAWAAYEQTGDTSGQARAVREIAESMSSEFWNQEDDMILEFNLIEVNLMRQLAQVLYIQAGDVRGQADMHLIIGQATRDRDTQQKALQEALEIYETLEDIAQQAKVLSMLADEHSDDRAEYRSYLERAFKLYMQIGDQRSAGRLCSALAELDYYEKNYAVARAAFLTAQALFREVRESVGLMDAIVRLGALILEADDYPAYVTYYHKTLRSLDHEPVDKCAMISFWHQVPKIAGKHQDFETARYAYQQAIVCATARREPQEQSDLYWRWGYMEYYEAGRKAMGFALCQWAMTLFQTYAPGSTHHRKQFAKMRREIVS
jgi:hypothetical protein